MSNANDNADPETILRIAQARSLPNHPWGEWLTPYKNIGALLTARVQEAPDKNWLTFVAEDDSKSCLSYEEFFDLARRVAGFLSSLGLSAGDRVATLMVNDPRTVLIYFGAWLLGATVVPINISEDDNRVAYILENSEAKALFGMSEQLQRCAGAFEGRLKYFVQVGGRSADGWIDFDKVIVDQQALGELPDLPPNTECLIVYTSGTTGAPKGVVLDQYNLLIDAKNIAEWFQFGSNDRAMNVLPIHHVNGTVVTIMTPLYSGGSVVMNRKFRAQAFWRTLAEEKCTWTSVVPTVLAFLCERHEDLAQYDLSVFRHIICGAGPLTTELAGRFLHLYGDYVVHGYGLSETTCYSCFLPAGINYGDHSYWMTECGFPSIGCPLHCNEMAIHDEYGNAQPPEARGEIVIRGHNVMRCYFKRPDANKDTFAHGWFRSGDEGFYRVGKDGRHYFFITGRLKELIIRGGVNYSPFDIDEVLNSIEGVRAAMAVGFENDFYGEEVGGYVQLEEGISLSQEEIIAKCREKLPFAKSPKVVIFGQDFPVTSTGKYQRLKLRPLFEQWKSAEFRQPKGGAS
jgi:long-chain acyl-CoA synthetase